MSNVQDRISHMTPNQRCEVLQAAIAQEERTLGRARILNRLRSELEKAVSLAVEIARTMDPARGMFDPQPRFDIATQGLHAFTRRKGPHPDRSSNRDIAHDYT